MAEYENGRSISSKDVLPAITMRSIDEYFSLFAVWTIFHHIYFCHEKTTMTSDGDIGKHDSSPCVNEVANLVPRTLFPATVTLSRKDKKKNKTNPSLITLPMLNYFPSIDWVGLANAFVELE